MIVGTLSISIHAPPRGATAGLGLAPLCPWHFNSRPSARGDPSLRPNSATLANYFNSRPSARGDYRRNFRCDAPPLFQFTPLREGRPDKKLWYTCRRYFNSRPSARGDPQEFSMRRAALISIHAPPRGATVRAAVTRRIVSVISIHAPPRGATVSMKLNMHTDAISIHAPPRGATGCAQATKDSCFISIHAPPRGATIHPRHVLDPEQFQFTPLREGRRQRPATPPWE